jgi:hypothetical protein
VPRRHDRHRIFTDGFFLAFDLVGGDRHS